MSDFRRRLARLEKQASAACRWCGGQGSVAAVAQRPDGLRPSTEGHGCPECGKVSTLILLPVGFTPVLMPPRWARSGWQRTSEQAESCPNSGA